MRQTKKPKSPMRKPAKKREPLAEGVVPLRRNGQRNWRSITDEELIGFTKQFMRRDGITWRKELRKADPGLYDILRRRELLDKVGLVHLRREMRNWTEMGDERLSRFAKGLIDARSINGRKELEEADKALYEVLRERGLLDKVGLGFKLRDWVAMEDEKVVRIARSFITNESIGGRKELEEADVGLYSVLLKRELLDKVGLKRKKRRWTAMKDEKLVGFAKRFLTENEIGGRWELQKADKGLYSVLKARGLLDEAFRPIERSRRGEAVKQVVDGLGEFGQES